MKRKIVMAVIAMNVLAIAGCSNNNDETATMGAVVVESSSVDNTQATAGTILELTEEDKANEELLLTFLTSLENGTASSEIGATYDFINRIKLDSYNYTLAANKPDYGTAFDVTFNVSKSDTATIPVGESAWRIVISPDISGYVSLFCPIENEATMKDSIWHSIYNPQEVSDIACKAAVEFSKATGIYSGDFSNYGTLEQASIRMLYQALPYQADGEKDTASSIADKIKKFYNLDVDSKVVEKALERETDESGNITWGAYGQGGTFMYTTAKVIKEDASGVQVEITYYGDTAYFAPAITATYSFSYNEDQTLHLESVETVTDYGYKPALGAV